MYLYEIPKDKEKLVFPDPNTSNSEGLLAFGGDLSVERLIFAYQNGIFPWYDEDAPILWWSPDPRFIIETKEFHLPKSVRKLIRKKIDHYSFLVDDNFEEVITICQKINRKEQDGTWITGDMKKAYINLYQAGIAHSVAVYEDKKLIGGLYGVGFGKMFAGESMFSLVSGGSKIALVILAQMLLLEEVAFIDCQQNTKLLSLFGGKEIARSLFLEKLKENTKENSLLDLASYNSVELFALLNDFL